MARRIKGHLDTPHKVAISFLGGIFLLFSGLSAIGALILFESNPQQAETLAGISSGMAMPALAMLTWWYASKTSEIAERENQRQEAELDGFRMLLGGEIRSHLMSSPGHPNHISFQDGMLPNSKYVENLDRVAMLTTEEQEKLKNYYKLVMTINTIPNMGPHGEGYTKLNEILIDSGREAMDILYENVSSDSEE